jgi:hypothetical protein
MKMVHHTVVYVYLLPLSLVVFIGISCLYGRDSASSLSLKLFVIFSYDPSNIFVLCLVQITSIFRSAFLPIVSRGLQGIRYGRFVSFSGEYQFTTVPFSSSLYLIDQFNWMQLPAIS